jgi:hypothetical protein
MSDGIMLTIGDDGEATLYDDTYDITIHCESKEEQDEVRKALENVRYWIPVTERLPEDGIPVNVTWVNRKPEFYYSEIKDKPYTATAIYFRGKWFWYSCVIEDWLAEYGSNESFLANLQEAVDRDIEITAWMPLPEAYKGVTE